MTDTLTGEAGLRRGADGYEAARRAIVSQARKPERYPDRIVAVRSADEVPALVRGAVARGEKISVRGSGHNYQGSSLRDGGLLLDLSALDHLEVDPERRIARVGPGVRGGQLGAVLDAHGLGFPGPHDPRVGVAGFLLAGGAGLNLGEWGPAALRIRAVRAVTAAGEVVRADETHLPDLLAAARGGGHAFPAVVTEFELDLAEGRPVKREIVFRFDIARTAEVAPLLDEIAAEVSPQVEFVVLFAPGRDGGFSLLARGWIWARTEEEADALAKPFARLGEPSKQLAFNSFDAWYAEYSTHHERQELRRAVDNFWIDQPAAAWLPEAAEIMVRSASPHSQLLALASPSWKRMAFDPQRAVYSKAGTWFAEPAAAWESDADDEANLAWTRELCGALDRRAHGHYLASVDHMAGPDRYRRCYEPAHWERLMAIVEKYDPTRVFHSPLGT